MKVTIEIEVTEEQLRAGNYFYNPGSKEKPEPMGGEEFVKWHLLPAVEARARALRDRMVWGEGRFYQNPNLRKEEGHTCRTLTDQSGKKHYVMIPSGHEYPVRVEQPREGTWGCEGSPSGKCWYDARKDPAWDFCVFCGDPHERK